MDFLGNLENDIDIMDEDNDFSSNFPPTQFDKPQQLNDTNQQSGMFQNGFIPNFSVPSPEMNTSKDPMDTSTDESSMKFQRPNPNYFGYFFNYFPNFQEHKKVSYDFLYPQTNRFFQPPPLQTRSSPKKPKSLFGSVSLSSFKRSDKVCLKDSVPYIRKLKKLKLDVKLPHQWSLELGSKLYLTYQLYYRANNEKNWNLLSLGKLQPIHFLFEPQIKRSGYILLPDEYINHVNKTITVPFELNCNQTQIVKTKSYKNTFKLQVIIYSDLSNISISFVYRYDTRHKNDKLKKQRYKKLTYFVGSEKYLWAKSNKDGSPVPVEVKEKIFEANFYNTNSQ